MPSHWLNGVSWEFRAVRDTSLAHLESPLPASETAPLQNTINTFMTTETRSWPYVIKRNVVLFCFSTRVYCLTWQACLAHGWWVVSSGPPVVIHKIKYDLKSIWIGIYWDRKKAYLLGTRSCWWVNTAKLLRTVLKLARTYEKNNIVGPYQKHILSTFFFIYSNLFTASYFDSLFYWQRINVT